MIAHVKKAILYMLASYWIVTVLVVLAIFGLSAIHHLPSSESLGVSVGQSPAYLMSMPFHPILNLPIWLLFSWLYLKPVETANLRVEGWRLGWFWVIVSIAKDYLVWVLIPSPVQMTPYEMYVEYQPWLTFIYLVILLSPVLTATVLGSRTKEVAL